MQCFRTCHWIHGSCPRFQEVVQASQKSSSLHKPPKNVCVQLLWNGRHDTIPVMCVCVCISRRNTYMHTYCVYIISIYIMYCQHVSSMPAPMFEVRISLDFTWNLEPYQNLSPEQGPVLATEIRHGMWRLPRSPCWTLLDTLTNRALNLDVFEMCVPCL